MKQKISRSFDLYKRRFAPIIGTYALGYGLVYAASSVFALLSTPVSWLVNGVMSVFFMKESEKNPQSLQDTLEIGKKYIWRLTGCNALITIKMLLWCLIPVVGVFIAVAKYYSYCFAPNVAYTRPGLSVSECLKASEKLAYGKRREMFLADLLIMGGAVAVLLIPIVLISVLITTGADTMAMLLILPLLLLMIGAFLLLGPLQGLVRARYFLECERLEGLGGFGEPIVLENDPIVEENKDEPNEKKQEF